jgi:hypothetical protein
MFSSITHEVFKILSFVVHQRFVWHFLPLHHVVLRPQVKSVNLFDGKLSKESHGPRIVSTRKFGRFFFFFFPMSLEKCLVTGISIMIIVVLMGRHRDFFEFKTIGTIARGGRVTVV